MDANERSAAERDVQTASGRIHYTEQGAGPVALFVHGVLWRHQLPHLSDIRRCIAVDLLAHGDTEIAPDQEVSVTANANMLREFLDALNIERVDLVGNDSGGGIAQIFAALHPQRVRSLTLTNCDAADTVGLAKVHIVAIGGFETLPRVARLFSLMAAPGAR
jgi:pimeloyl-ACP methyl ester carboxylesterase